jgi:histidinol dehydrogenase
MLAVPAKIAGVKETVMFTPPVEKRGDPASIVAADIVGVDRIFRIGGPQAIAAMAFGTATIRPVDKIVGPGNVYVATAKRLVFGIVGIDMVAGPSEVLVIANDQANPAWVAADMLSQAEHAPDSSAIVMTDSEPLAKLVLSELQKQVAELPRAKAAKESLTKHSAIIVLDNMAGAIEAEDADKAARLMQLCNAHGLPMLSLCDTPGFMVGPEIEHRAQVRHRERRQNPQQQMPERLP